MSLEAWGWTEELKIRVGAASRYQPAAHRPELQAVAGATGALHGPNKLQV